MSTVRLLGVFKPTGPRLATFKRLDRDFKNKYVARFKKLKQKMQRNSESLGSNYIITIHIC